MTKFNLMGWIIVSILCLTLISCKENPVNKIQGVFIADKESLKKISEEKMQSDNAFASRLLNKVIENAVMEFRITGDSIKGLVFIAGQSNSINAKIETRNDSLFIQTESSNVFLIPNEKGFLYNNIQMTKSTDQEDLSPETKSALTNVIKKEKELKEFKENLGVWRKGNFVDEFGDDTGEGYPFAIVSGTHQTSTIVNSDVYVKCIFTEGKIYFEIYDTSLSYKENFPDSEFGTIKIKFPSGEVQTEKVFFYKNAMFESSDDKKALIYNHLVNNEGELKILVDLSTASSYQTDKYQFTIQMGNLDKVLGEVKAK